MSESRSRHRANRRIASAVACVGIVGLLMSGCVGVPAPTATPSASFAAEPIFASDEEALVAAEAAYEAYIAVSQVIGESGGTNPDRILDVVSPGYAEDVIADFENMADQGLRVVGANTLDTTSLVEHSEEDGVAIVSIYACVGVGSTRILDKDGKDLTPAERDEKVPLILSFETGGASQSLVLSGSELWSGEDFC